MRIGWIGTAAGLLAIAAGSYAAYLFVQPAPLPEELLYGNGHIEGIEVRVAAEVSGRIVESHILEGQQVAQGDPLATIDSSDIDLRSAQARSEIGALEGERDRTRRELEIWQHHLETAEANLARYERLSQSGAVARQGLEQVQNTVEEAKGRIGALEAAADAVNRRIDAARKGLELVGNQQTRTRVLAPIDGAVLVKTAQEGEFVQPGRSIAVLVDLSRLELRIYIPESDIGKVRLDAPARVRVDAFPERFFQARVARVSQQALFTPREIHMPEERVRMVFGVTLLLENPEGVLKPGMPADAWVLWRQGVDWPDRLAVPR